MSFYKCRERCTAIKICWPLGYFRVLRPMASRIRGCLKTLGFCVGAVGAAVGATVFCVGAVGAGGKGYVEYLHLSGPYGPYAKNSGPYNGPYGPYKLPIALFMSVYQCTWVSFSLGDTEAMLRISR